MKRSTKEYIIINSDEIQVKLGTIDRLNPQVFYIFGKTWITPTYDGDYEYDLKIILKNFNNEIKNFTLKNNLSIKFISTFDINYDSLILNNKNYFTFEFVFKQKNTDFNIKEIKNNFNNEFKNIIDYFIKNLSDNGFYCQQKR